MDADATDPTLLPSGSATEGYTPPAPPRPSRYTDAELDALIEEMANRPIPAPQLIGRDQFLADFPELMAHRETHPVDRYAAYHGRIRLGFASDHLAAIRLCRDRGLDWRECCIMGIDVSVTYHEPWPPAPNADRRP